MQNIKPSYGFGIDVGGTTVKLGFFRTDGSLLDKWEIPTNTANDGVAILPDIAAAITARCTAAGIEQQEVLGIGIGVPGPVRSSSTVHGCVSLGWGIVNVAEILSGLTGLPVRVTNDANVAALGEMWQGGIQGKTQVVMVTLGTGVGGGIIVNGKVTDGGTGAAGEIGHIIVNPSETERCNCGRRGCLQQYVSATGIVRMTKAKLAAAKQRQPQTATQTAEAACMAAFSTDSSRLTARDVYDAAKAGDAFALEIADEVGRILGGALANIACVVNPDVIVIGGGVSRAGSTLLDPIQAHFRAAAFPACQDTMLTLAALGNDAGIYGAMKLILG